MNINPIELSKIDGITLMDGLKYCGSLRDFDKFLEAFYVDIESNSDLLEETYKSGDISFFTIKVHALKTSARMIGATELSQEALNLEMAGKSNDIGYIDANIWDFLSYYRSYKNKLDEYMTEKQRLRSIKKPISEDELNEAFSALREVCPTMDYGAVEMILEELAEYKLPQNKQKQIDKLVYYFKKLQWDEVEKVLMS